MSLANDVSSVGGSAEIVLPAVANTYYVLQRLLYSYSSSISLGAGTLTIQFGANTVFNLNLKDSLADFNNIGLQTNVNEAVTITVSGITLLTAKLNAFYDTYTT